MSAFSRFQLQIEGLKNNESMNVTSVSGLAQAIECTEFAEGKDKIYETRKGKIRNDMMTVQRAFTGDDSFYQWFKECKEKAVVRRSGSVIVFDDDKKEVCRVNFTAAWPTRWAAPALELTEYPTTPLETIVFAIGDLDFVGGKAPRLP